MDWVAMLEIALPARPSACRWLLNEMFFSPANLKELLLAQDDAVRDAAASVFHAALRQVTISAGGGPNGDAAGEAYNEAFETATEGVRSGAQGEASADGENDEGFVTVNHGPKRSQGRERASKESGRSLVRCSHHTFSILYLLQ